VGVPTQCMSAPPMCSPSALAEAGGGQMSRYGRLTMAPGLETPPAPAPLVIERPSSDPRG